MKLYTYFRSSAAYRVRIALGLKGLAYAAVPVHLVRGGPDGGPENRGPAYRAVNPQARVPALTLDDGTTLIQSAAIFEWLEETHPTPALLPADPIARARVRAIVGIVNDIQPLQNTFALNALKSRFGADAAALAAGPRGSSRTGSPPSRRFCPPTARSPSGRRRPSPIARSCPSWSARAASASISVRFRGSAGSRRPCWRCRRCRPRDRKRSPTPNDRAV